MHGLEWMRFLVVNVMFMMRNTMMEDKKKIISKIGGSKNLTRISKRTSNS